MEEKTDTKYDKVVRRFKNNHIVIVFLIVFAVIIGLSQFIDAAKSMLNAISIKTPSSESRQDTTPEQLPVQNVEKGKVKAKTAAPISLKDIKGDVVISQNQTGGITAHTVNINKPEKRNIKTSFESIFSELKKHPNAVYRLHYSTNDVESVDLANDIDRVLQEANWKRIHPITRVAGPSFPKGITIFMLNESEEAVTLFNQLWISLGNEGVEGQVCKDLDNIFKIHGYPPVELPKGTNGIVIFIGPNPDN